MPKRYDSILCGEQLTRRGELLGFLQAGWSPPNVTAPGLPRAPSGAIGIPRTPTGKPILFGNCAPHPGASACISFTRGLYAFVFICIRRSVTYSKIAKCGILLPSSSAVTISGLDRLINEGVTLCGHACFNTTCSLATVLKGGADCETCITARLRTLGSRRKTFGRASPALLQCRDLPDIPIDTHQVSVLRKCSPVPVRVRVSNFWKVSGFVAGFVMTVLCLSRRTVLHTLHARMFSALFEFCTSHLK